MQWTTSRSSPRIWRRTGRRACGLPLPGQVRPERCLRSPLHRSSGARGHAASCCGRIPAPGARFIVQADRWLAPFSCGISLQPPAAGSQGARSSSCRHQQQRSSGRAGDALRAAAQGESPPSLRVREIFGRRSHRPRRPSGIACSTPWRNSPSVTTSIRVVAGTTVPIRTLYHPRFPTASFSPCSQRWAAAVGSQPPGLQQQDLTACLPWTLELPRIIARGNLVVLPAPGWEPCSSKVPLGGELAVRTFQEGTSFNRAARRRWRRVKKRRSAEPASSTASSMTVLISPEGSQRLTRGPYRQAREDIKKNGRH